MAEGVTLLSEALAAGAALESVYAAPGAPEDLLAEAGRRGARVFTLAPGVIERVADTATPQPVMAVLAMPSFGGAALAGADAVVVCVDVRDPGNAGTVMRSAVAAGFGALIMCGTSVDPYNPKTVRASAGAIFRLPVVVAAGTSELIEDLGRAGLKRVAAVSAGGRAPWELDLSGPVALLVGNEAHGLGPDALSTVEELVTIPMAADTESLNVGVATAVICFEAVRQRRAAGKGAPA